MVGDPGPLCPSGSAHEIHWIKSIGLISELVSLVIYQQMHLSYLKEKWLLCDA